MDQVHPFARYVAALGRGPGRGRDLEEAEAEAAMADILAGRVAPEQLGALLMLMRYKRETAVEIAGFVRAVRAALPVPVDPAMADLDWPSYADRHRQLPWFVLSALLLAENGVRVVMHGIAGAPAASTRTALDALGVAAAASADEAAARVAETGFAYLPLEVLCPPLAALFDLRPLLGLRSPVNSVARVLNPLGARHQIIGVFHPTYRPLHQEAAARLNQPRAAVFKGGGGEAQRNPDKPCLVATVRDGALAEERWPALRAGSRYAWRGEELEVARLAALWRGDLDDPAPTAAVVGTAAVALRLLDRAADMGTAEALARELWDARPRRKFGRDVRLSA